MGEGIRLIIPFCHHKSIICGILWSQYNLKMYIYFLLFHFHVCVVCMCVCMFVNIHVFVGVHVCEHVCVNMWGPGVDVRSHLQSFFSCLLKQGLSVRPRSLRYS